MAIELPTLHNRILDGWHRVDSSLETWEFNSSSTNPTRYTVDVTGSNPLTGKYEVGNMVKLTQLATEKFFYIDDVQSGTLDLVAGTDYTLTNDDISEIYVASGGRPHDFPPFFNFTPGWFGNTTNPVIANGSLNGKFSMHGGMTKATFRMLAGSNTTFGSGFWTLGLPSRAGNADKLQLGTFYCRDNTVSSTQYVASGYVFTTTRLVLDVASGARANVDFNSPFNWANTDELRGELVYWGV